MKRIIYIVLPLIFTFFISGCSKQETAYVEPEKPNIRCELLYDRKNAEGVENGVYNGSYDFDSDGTEEKISVECIGKNEEFTYNGQTETYYHNEYVNVSIGEKTYKFEDFIGQIDSVYICDIDEKDGVKDLALIMADLDISYLLRIFKYGEKLTPYNFSSLNFDKKTVLNNFLSISSVDSYFNIEQDGTITTKTLAGISGMWETYKKYSRNSNGIFEENRPEYYEILPEFMEEKLALDSELTGEEREKWENGYVKAYTNYTGEDITIKKNEYFKVKFDDGNGKVYIEKENGDSGWIYIGYDMDSYHPLNDKFFYLAM